MDEREAHGSQGIVELQEVGNEEEESIIHGPGVEIRLNRKTANSSEAWKHFGYLYRDGRQIDLKHVYCLPCFKLKKCKR